MKRRVSLSLVVGGTLCWLLVPGLSRSGMETQSAGEKRQPPLVSSIEQTRAMETSRLQMLEKEAALHAKEQELQRLSASIDKQIKELDSARKAMEGATAGKNRESGERAKRLLKIYKSLKPEEAAKLMNALDEELTLAMLDQLDKKTVTKLIPLLNQPRVLEWTRENFPAEE